MSASLDAARIWIGQDPDETTRAELQALITRTEAGDPDAGAELSARFAGRLNFGTAGLRGELGAGPLRMNRVVVAQAAAGLASYLLARESNPSVVIGYDGRYMSEVFARDTAEIMEGTGVRAILLPRMLPTPVLAFAVRHFDAKAGVMVTASHNPAKDNGYKVYLGGDNQGSQIVSPDDELIQAEIVRVAEKLSIIDLARSDKYTIADERVVSEYIRRTAKLSTGASTLKVVYTPMHGVGWDSAKQIFAEAGFSSVTAVKPQQDPDPRFPSVAFPNPEEPGAMDLAFAEATKLAADLVIANDPDADRVAVGVPDGSGGWVRLSGNEVGWLLGWRAARQLQEGGDKGTFACSLVSSPALGVVAEEYGLNFAETLTGFKWISRIPGLRYGYEEALGYLVDPDKVRDKDGLSAAIAVVSLFQELADAGTSFAAHRTEFAQRFGAFASGQISIRVADLAEIPVIMGSIRNDPPEAVSGIAVTRVDDFTDGFASFPPSDLLRFWLADGSRIILRPSGTEPKLKCYLDTRSNQGTPKERFLAAESTRSKLDTGMRELLKPAKEG